MILNTSTKYYFTHALRSLTVPCYFPLSHHAVSITSHFTDLREVLGPHLDLLLHELLPVESFILQSLLRLLPPPPLLLQHLTASQALSFLEESAFIKYFFDLCERFAEKHAALLLSFFFPASTKA